MTILLIFSPPIFYPDSLRPLDQVSPAEVWIVLVLPVAVAVSAAAGPPAVVVVALTAAAGPPAAVVVAVTAAAWPPLVVLGATVAAW
ncbi:MAG TPA: hypothetical protein VIJ89_03755, partial [Deferrimonas sp.]